jgi:hypothetical protein
MLRCFHRSVPFSEVLARKFLNDARLRLHRAGKCLLLRMIEQDIPIWRADQSVVNMEHWKVTRRKAPVAQGVSGIVMKTRVSVMELKRVAGRIIVIHVGSPGCMLDHSSARRPEAYVAPPGSTTDFRSDEQN